LLKGCGIEEDSSLIYTGAFTRNEWRTILSSYQTKQLSIAPHPIIDSQATQDLPFPPKSETKETLIKAKSDPLKGAMPKADNRKTIPGILKDFKPAIYNRKKKDMETQPQSPFQKEKQTLQEFRCRDCKKPFCRRGDRDNHEKAEGHERWRVGKGFSLAFE
jgi:hypothetical protein